MSDPAPSLLDRRLRLSCGHAVIPGPVPREPGDTHFCREDGEVTVTAVTTIRAANVTPVDWPLRMAWLQERR